MLRWILLLCLFCLEASGFTPAPFSSSSSASTTSTEHWLLLEDTFVAPQKQRRQPTQRSLSFPTQPGKSSFSSSLLVPPLVDNYSDNSRRADVMDDASLMDPNVCLHNLLQGQVDLLQQELETQRAQWEDRLEHAEQQATQERHDLWHKGLAQLQQEREVFDAQFERQQAEERLATAQTHATLEQERLTLQQNLDRVQNETAVCRAERLEMQCELVRLSFRVQTAQEQCEEEHQSRHAQHDEHTARVQRLRDDMQQEMDNALLDRTEQLATIQKNYTRQWQSTEDAIRKRYAKARECRFDCREMAGRLATLERERTQLRVLLSASVWLVVQRLYKTTRWVVGMVLQCLNAWIWQRDMVQRRVQPLRAWVLDQWHHPMRISLRILQMVGKVVWAATRFVGKLWDRVVWQRPVVQVRVHRLRNRLGFANQ